MDYMVGHARSGIVLTVAGMMSVIALVPGSPAARADPVNPRSSQQLTDWRDKRIEFGFDSSDAHLRDVSQDALSTSADIGVPLSRVEQTEMVRRRTLGRVVGAITSAGDQVPGFGGVEVNQSAGGVVLIKIVDYDPGDTLAIDSAQSLAGLVSIGNPFSVVSVPYSAATLANASLQVQNAFTSGQLKKYQIHIGCIIG